MTSLTRAEALFIAAEMNQSRAAFEHRLQALSTQIERLRRPARQTAFQDHAEASPDLHSPAPTGDAKAPTTLPSEQVESAGVGLIAQLTHQQYQRFLAAVRRLRS